MTKNTVLAIKYGLKALGLVSPNLAAKIAVQLFLTPAKIQRPEWEKKILQTGTPVTLAGLRATAWGIEAAPAVILVHGWMGRGSQLSMLAAPLVERGFRVLALDGPAHGDSGGKTTNVTAFSQALARVVNEIGNVEAIVAHSFGAGATALGLVRGQLAIKKAVLVASPADFQKVLDFFAKSFDITGRNYEAFNAKARKVIGLKPEETDVAIAGRNLSVKALIVHDPQDKEVQFISAKRFAENWPNAELLALEKVGHYKILKAPSFIEGVVNFLGSPQTQLRVVR